MVTMLFLALVLGFFFGVRLFAVMIFLCAIGAIASPRSFDAEFSGWMSGFLEMGTGEAANVFSTIPLFIYAGYLMAASKTADRLVRVSNAALGWMPGGLGIVTIMACAVYTTFTGASGVTIVALGSLLMPALIKQGYPERFSLGLVTGTGSVGLLFPPALPLFIFGTVLGLQQELTAKWMNENPAWEWQTERFVWAGIVPGLVLVGLLSLVVIGMAVYRKVPRQGFDLRELGRSFVVALPELALPFLIIAALATGLGGIAQIAALTVVYLLLVEMVVYRDVKPIDLWHITRESMALIGAIFIIVFASKVVTNYLVTADVPTTLVEWTREHIGSKWAFLLALNVLLLVVGMMMDIFSAILIVLPLIAPIAQFYGVNPYHLGVIFLLNLEIGYLTPPVGLNLFISSFKFRKPVIEVVWSVLPFMGTMIVALLIVTYVPSLTYVPPPKARGTLDNLVQVAGTAKRASVNPAEIVLPNRIYKRQRDCLDLLDDNKREECIDLFSVVGECRADADQAAAHACEKDAIVGWFNVDYKDEPGIVGLLRRAKDGPLAPTVPWEDGGGGGGDGGDGGFEDDGEEPGSGAGGFEAEGDEDAEGGDAKKDDDEGAGGFEAMGEEDEEGARPEEKKQPDGEGPGGFEEMGEEEETPDAAAP